MKNPYERYLEDLVDHEITIQRADVSELTGKLINLGEDGCTIEQLGPPGQAVIHVFVAYDHIRGVASETWDLENTR